MTIRKKATLEIQAREWLQKYQQSPDADMEHPAVQAIRDLADTGVLFNSNPAMDDLFLQMRSLEIRSGGESYEKTLAIMAESTPMSESTIGRRIKRKATMPPEIQALTGNDSLSKILLSHILTIVKLQKRG